MRIRKGEVGNHGEDLMCLCINQIDSSVRLYYTMQMHNWFPEGLHTFRASTILLFIFCKPIDVFYNLCHSNGSH